MEAGSTMWVTKATKGNSQIILNFIRKKAKFDGETRGFDCEVISSREKIERTIFCDNPFANVLLLKDCNDDLGFALYHTRYSSFSGNPSIWLDDLFVNSSNRSLGGGLIMMNALKEQGVEMGASHISWTASIHNTRGASFYNRLGAKVERTEGNLHYYSLFL
jgi:GNAT superfamily N-acetyltransferase